MVRFIISALVLVAFVSTASAQLSDVPPLTGSGFEPGGPGGAPDANEYQSDDGVAENSIGATAAGSLAWIQRYNVLSNREVITGIRVRFGTPLQINGRAVTAYLWSDPNQDNSPADAMVLASAPGIVSGAQAAAPINFDPGSVLFDIPDTVAGSVGQSFFIGVIMQAQNAGEFPAPVDQTDPDPGPGFQWAAVGPSNGMNPNAIPAPIDLNTIAALRGDWLLRADAVPIPEPASLAFLSLAGLLALRRR